MCEAPIVDVRLLARKSIMGYQFDAQAPFLRIVTALPSLVATCRRVLENGVPVPTGGSFQFETYESNWAYVLRFMVDREVAPPAHPRNRPHRRNWRNSPTSPPVLSGDGMR